jgi:hypothetical protein
MLILPPIIFAISITTCDIISPLSTGVTLLYLQGGTTLAKTSPTAPFSHWYTLIEDFQISSTDFYSSLRAGIQRRQVPDAETIFMEYKESGLMSARRTYLRVMRGKYVFDICAAPFGTGYFFSWWLGEKIPSPVGPTLALIAIVIFLWNICLSNSRFPDGLYTFIGAVVFLILLLGAAVAQGEAEWVDSVLVIPILGRIIRRLFRPDTYYRIDTALMFQEAVHAAVLEVIDGLTSAKGIRALTEAQRRPIHRGFYLGAHADAGQNKSQTAP